MEAFKTILFLFAGILLLNVILDAVISSTSGVGGFIVIGLTLYVLYLFSVSECQNSRI